MRELKLSNKAKQTGNYSIGRAQLSLTGRGVNYKPDTDTTADHFDIVSIKAHEEQYQYYDIFTKQQIKR